MCKYIVQFVCLECIGTIFNTGRDIKDCKWSIVSAHAELFDKIKCQDVAEMNCDDDNYDENDDNNDDVSTRSLLRS